jgi:hypothetical protein
MPILDSCAALRALYAEPRPRAVRKQLDRLDVHCRSFIAPTPFAVLELARRCAPEL